ncbi:MAG: PadR family transcriptional regulator [Oscillospiraceae bacterium]|jgi:DNA-binding PadR family transcriptional regulator|nr:PadR family transcriptional regulator [Oscillospiraceae bacterium]
MSESEQLHGYITELRRGALTLAVLGSLTKPCYGYALLQSLQQKQILIEANTLYPLLRRLEAQGLLQSDWDTAESRPRKYYSISEKGKEIYQGLLAEWNSMQQSMKAVFRRENDNE